MSAEDVVNEIAGIVAKADHFTEEDVYLGMAERGLPESLADRAYKFSQIAWGRAILDGLGVSFAPDYACFNRAGDVVESGQLLEQPYFMAAAALANDPSGLPGLAAGIARVASMSAEFNAINNALNAGAKPGNLVSSTALIFLELPAAVALKHATTDAAESAASRRKPWWRFR